MKTLYNTQTEQHGAFYEQPYTVDGKPGILPDHILELDVVEQPYPTITEFQKAEPVWVVDEVAKEYRREWTVRDLTAEEKRARYSRITKLQGLLMSEQLGIYDELQTALSAADKFTKIAFENALYWDITSPLIVNWSQSLGMTEADLDNFFLNASKIEVE